MTYFEAIKSGFRLINRYWQLVAVQAGMMLFNCIGFFVMVGIPLGIAFVIFGLDLTGLANLEDAFGLFRDPGALFSKYFGLILIVLISIFFFILLVTTVGIYVFAGSIGVIGSSLLEPNLKFGMRRFFDEARKFFFPLMWFSVFVGLVIIVAAFVLGLFGGGIAAVVSSSREQNSTLGLFLGVFLSLLLALIGLASILGILAVTVYGIAVLFFKGGGAVKAFKGAFRFLLDHQQAFLLYAILFIGYVIANFTIMLVVYPFNLIPLIGPVISFPFQILSYVVQGYLGLVMLAALFTYYFRIEVQSPAQAVEGSGGTISGTSTQAEGISPSQAEGPGPLPGEKEPPEQD